MKIIILRISVIILLIAFVGVGCEKDDEDLSYLDKSKSFYTGVMPRFAVYKTKKDYFFNVGISPYADTFHSPELDENSASITLYNGKYYCSERYRLNDNYVVAYAISLNYVFTSLSYDAYIREKLSPQFNQGAPNPKVINSIIDSDPFTEFYYSKESFDGKAGITITELNQLIKEKGLEKYFIKLK